MTRGAKRKCLGAVPGGRSTGIVRKSSRECCDEGIMSSPGGGVVEEGVVEGGAETSDWDERVTTSYPDPPSVSIISGAPSTESRRDRVAVDTSRSLRPLPTVTTAPGLSLEIRFAGSEGRYRATV